MIWPVWAVFVLVGSGWAYVAFVQKEAPIWTSLLTVGCFTVAGFGSFAIEQVDGSGGTITSTETAAAILCFMTAAGAALVFLASATGQYGAPDREDRPDAGRLNELEW